MAGSPTRNPYADLRRAGVYVRVPGTFGPGFCKPARFRVRSAALVRDGHDALALPAPPGGTGVSMFTARRLAAPWALSPSTTNPDTVREWLTWTTVGVEGVVFARLDDPYRPAVRGWLKYKVRETTEAIVGAITGPLSVPRRGFRTPTARKALLTTRRYPARAWAWSSSPSAAGMSPGTRERTPRPQRATAPLRPSQLPQQQQWPQQLTRCDTCPVTGLRVLTVLREVDADGNLDWAR